ncbi:hypothetical protein HPB48_013634 [Haemaphysalis longicornis]|uniref:DUF4371 domain-containing protein n=1 Tax=Haemaphysalis longicornis TaxID=44386 RepID=A0A9J6FCZ6_HAELO|nr:hypothetical protein HPB48_013634 [Haemaphysalis longicornis]
MYLLASCDGPITGMYIGACSPRAGTARHDSADSAPLFGAPSDQGNLCRGALAQQNAAMGKEGASQGSTSTARKRPGQTMKLTSFFAKVPKLNQQAKGELEDNKAKLRAIVETVLLCGRQDLALRDDKDSGRLSLEEPLQNDGNFRALLRYRANGGDIILTNHIRAAGSNALYSSPHIQNEIISIIGKLTQDKIVRQVNEAGFFSVLADETTDLSQTEQFSLRVRYVDPTTSSIREDFLCFVHVDGVSASSLADTRKRELQNLGLHLDMMRGQGYDGAAAMSGAFNGVQALIRNDFPTALYTHCSLHSLNLCLSDASAVQDIRRAFGTISEVCTFFRLSPKRTAVLKKHLEASTKSFRRLRRYCETRWVERHDSVALFGEALSEIVHSLEEFMGTSPDKATASTAHCLHQRICSFNFLLCLAVSKTFLGLTHHLSVYLQSPAIHMIVALEQVDLVLTKLDEMGTNAEAEFHKICFLYQDRAAEFGVKCEIPRVVGTQRYRANYPCSSAEEYYRRATFIPYIDDLKASLKRRFANHGKHCKVCNLYCQSTPPRANLNLCSRPSIFTPEI